MSEPPQPQGKEGTNVKKSGGLGRFIGGSLRKFGIVVWKNVLIRKHQWAVSFFEFFGAFMLGLILVWFSSFGVAYLQIHLQEEAEKSGISGLPEWKPKVLTFDSKTETIILSQSDLCSHSAYFTAYAPSNSDTDRVMTGLLNLMCPGLNGTGKLKGFPSETELERSYEREDWKENTWFIGAIVFPDGLKQLHETSTQKDVSYKIRMRPGWCPATNKSLPEHGDEDFNWHGPNFDNEIWYRLCGFLALQLGLDKVITWELTKQATNTEISLQPLPYPPFEFDFLQAFSWGIDLFTVIPVYLSFTYGVIFTIASIARNIITEKNTGIAELLRLTGVSIWLQWLGWLFHVMVPQLFVTFFMLIVLFTNVLLSNDDQELITIEESDPFLVFCILLLYVLATVSITFLLSVIIKRPTIVTATLILVWVQSGMSSMGLFFDWYCKKFRQCFIVALLFPNAALALALRNIVLLESAPADESDMVKGMQWSNLGAIIGGIRTSTIMLILLFQSFGLLALSFYLDSVLPSKYGVRRPWYFFTIPLTRFKKVWPQKALPVVDNKSSKTAPTESVAGFEAEPVGAQVGVDIQNIHKKFGRYKRAVDGVSLKMFSGDIFALLGHNGAGKTTLISVLTGFYSPTSGTAIINGIDIKTDLNKARQSMGLCPQHNMIFEKLTVMEQLAIFGMLRGQSLKQAKAEGNALLQKMQIADKKNVAAKKLSGGQLRKLCLAISLIGGAKVVILDEPTSGMDPQARREIWDMLLQLRGQRTILLTTHFMEEADCLGDRIGIMADGKLQCCGTSAFLKRYYGSGHTLRLTFQADKENEPSENVKAKVSPAAEAIFAAVQKNIEDVQLKEETRVDSATNEVALTLPSETTTTAALSQMFANLTANKERLKIKTMGLAQTTIDDVFVRVGELAENQKPTSGTPEPTAAYTKADKVKNGRVFGQIMAILVKKFLYSIRKWVLLLFQCVIPLLLALLAASSAQSKPPATTKESNQYSRKHIALPITFDPYDSPVTVFSTALPPDVPSVVGPSATSASDVLGHIIKVGEEDRVAYKRKYAIALDGTSSAKIYAKFNLYPYHAAPLAINMASNLALKYADPAATYRILVTSHPMNGEDVEIPKLPHKLKALLERSKDNSRVSFRLQKEITSEPPNNEHTRSNQNENDTEHPPSNIAEVGTEVKAAVVTGPVATCLTLGLGLLSALMIVAPLEEKKCKIKQIQSMTGVSPLVYWLSTFIWDYFLYFLVVLAMLLVIVIYERSNIVTLSTINGCATFIFIAMAYGFPAIFFCYILSNQITSVVGGFILQLLLLTTLMIYAAIMLSLETSIGRVQSICRGIGQLFPPYNLLRACYHYTAISVENEDCEEESFVECQKPYLQWETMVQAFLQHGNGRYLVPGITQEVFFMVLFGFVFAGWLFVIEYKVFRRLKQLVFKEKANAFPFNIKDNDVVEEERRVSHTIASGKLEEDCIFVQDICKSYGNLAAVNHLSFGVHHGECFGLLGVNGAGKTTAFRIITGDEVPSFGRAFGFRGSSERNPTKFFSNIGYCPQFDPILAVLTGKEMLMVFAGLKGVPYEDWGKQAMIWLKLMGLEGSAKVKCGNYSGGMKRRLSAAIAMIGDPRLVLLDEPTTGVDPVARRQLWKILKVRKEFGQSIILTSHSMEECEALCARLGIMVNGQFQCFGGVQHLKNKFAQGYSLTLKLKQDLEYEKPEIQAEIDKLVKSLREKFKPCELKDAHQNIFQFILYDSSLQWDALFKSMENFKEENVKLIEDYSVNETSLEDVFLSFARMQHPERRANVGMCTKIFTCSC